MSLRYRTIAVVCSAGLYLAALLLPAVNIYTRGTGGDCSHAFAGHEAFHMGWAALVAQDSWDVHRGVLALGWLVNPAIWAALGFLAAGRCCWAGSAAAMGLVLALAVFPWYYALVWDQPGYWAWLASAALLLERSWFAAIRLRTHIL